MKNIKSFESFSMNVKNCERCGEATNGRTIMSMFNEDIICMDCKDKEKNDPKYNDAHQADIDSIKSGDYNFKGIGNSTIKKYN